MLNTTYEAFVQQHLRQQWLRQLCASLTLLPTLIVLSDLKCIDDVDFQRYFGSLMIALDGKPIFHVGRYALIDYNAQEDIVFFLQHLLSASGKCIRYLNYYLWLPLKKRCKSLRIRTNTYKCEWHSCLTKFVACVATSMGDTKCS